MSSDESARPLVSIVLPTHNGARYLRESIDSCLRQTHANLELIIVNDGSTDNTEEIILSYDDPRLIYTMNALNMGLPRSLNVGFRLARGMYLTWTSDDNCYLSHALETMLGELRRREHGVQFVYSDYDSINEEGRITRRARPLWRRSPRLRQANIVGACFLYTRRVYETVGEYNPDLCLAEDYEYWLRVFYRFRMYHVPAVLYHYRLHPGSLTHQGGDRIQAQALRARDSALRTAPTPRRLWESLVGCSPLANLQSELYEQVIRAWIRLEERLRPRRRLRALTERYRGQR